MEAGMGGFEIPTATKRVGVPDGKNRADFDVNSGDVISVGCHIAHAEVCCGQGAVLKRFNVALPVAVADLSFHVSCVGGWAGLRRGLRGGLCGHVCDPAVDGQGVLALHGAPSFDQDDVDVGLEGGQQERVRLAAAPKPVLLA